MKKLVAITMVVLATATMAMAVPTFTLPSLIEVTPGIPLEVTVGTTGGSVQGMDLFLGVSSPFALSMPAIDSIDGLLFKGNSTGASSLGSGAEPQIWMMSVTTLSGTVTLGAPAAKMIITVPVGTPIGTTGIMSTNLEVVDSAGWAGTASAFYNAAGDPTVQATANLKVVPEPATALLLLAAVPFLRRRHA